MTKIKFTKLVKIESSGQERYELSFTKTGRLLPITVPVLYYQVEKLIMEFHYIGVLGNRRESGNGFITEWSNY